MDRPKPATTEQVIQYFKQSVGIHRQLYDDNNCNQHCIVYNDSSYRREAVNHLTFKLGSRNKKGGEMMDSQAKPKYSPLYADNNTILIDSHKRYQNKIKFNDDKVLKCPVTLHRKKYVIRFRS